MDLSVVVSLVVSILEYCLPFTLVFGFTAKLTNFALDMIFNKKIEL